MSPLEKAEAAALLLCAMPASGKAFTTAAYRRLLRNLQASSYSNALELQGLSEEKLLHLTGNAQLAQSLTERLKNLTYLQDWLSGIREQGIQVLSIYSPDYPGRILRSLGTRAPVVLFCTGNLSLLNERSVSLVGSRNLYPAGIAFAEEAGRQIAAHNLVYCSGGARGADSCGFGTAIPDGNAVLFLPGSLLEEMRRSVYADALHNGKLVLVSEQGFDLPFTAARALSRNRLIHSFSELVLIAECREGIGGTWNGTMDNLKNHWSDLYVCADDPENPGSAALLEHGCMPITRQELSHLDTLTSLQTSIF